MNRNILKFGLLPWRPATFFGNIRTLCRNVHRSKERITKGYCDADLWWFGDYIPSLLGDAIEQFRKETHGYPCYLTEEKWDAILTDMAATFKESVEGQQNKLDTIWDNLDISDSEQTRQWADLEGEIEEYRRFKKQEALKLFARYIEDLWD